MRGYTPYLLRVNVYIHATDSDNPRRLYTAKLVKRILIDGSAGGAVNLEEAFRPSSAPKLVHITPLYSDVGGKTKLVYYTDMLDNGRYYFFVGGVYCPRQYPRAPSAFEIIDALANASPVISMGGRRFYVLVQSIESVDVESTSEKALEALNDTGRLRIVFASPTLLRDPLVRAKHKSLVPTPLNIFSTPVYILHTLNGNPGRLKVLLKLHRIFGVPHTYLETLRIVRVLYRKNPIPALAGYVNLHLNPPKIPPDLEDLIKETLTLMQALGTGTSRATGFGHVKLDPKTSIHTHKNFKTETIREH